MRSGESFSTRLIVVFRFLVCVSVGGEWREREVARSFTDYMKSCRGCMCVCACVCGDERRRRGSRRRRGRRGRRRKGLEKKRKKKKKKRGKKKV